MKPPLALSRGCLAALLLLTAVSAHAVVIALTGGDPGEGFVPLGSTFAAVDTGGAGGLAVQGVLFTASNANIALSPVSTQPGIFSSPPFVSTTTNDANLLTIGNTSVFNIPGPITLTISGLTAGTLYQVDSFIGLGSGFNSRIEQVSAVGLTPVTDSQSIGGANVLLYDVRQSLLPSLAGQIVVTYAVTSGNPSPNLNAISVTTAAAAPAAVPEAGTALAGVLAVGVCGLLRRRRM